MIACVLVATAVYDQGVVGVYLGDDAEKDARAAAAEIWAKTDGHHSFRVDKLEVGKTYERVFRYQSPFRSDDKPAAPCKSDPDVEVDDRTSAA